MHNIYLNAHPFSKKKTNGNCEKMKKKKTYLFTIVQNKKQNNVT